jgi:hypothetical protein
MVTALEPFGSDGQFLGRLITSYPGNKGHGLQPTWDSAGLKGHS